MDTGGMNGAGDVGAAVNEQLRAVAFNQMLGLPCERENFARREVFLAQLNKARAAAQRRFERVLERRRHLAAIGDEQQARQIFGACVQVPTTPSSGLLAVA